MAGIGFELKKLYSKRGVFASLRASSYSTAVCAGPMILGTLLLLMLMLECKLFGRSGHERELLVCMNTYSLLYSLLVTSVFSMIVTRFIADMLFSGHEETVLPSFFGVNLITLGFGGITYGIFLCFCGSAPLRCIFCWLYFMELIVTWNSQSYLNAVKEYRSILISYVIAIVATGLVTALMFWLGYDTVSGALFALIVGFGLMLVYDFIMIYHRFPDSNISPFMFLRWIDRFGKLAFTGLFMTVGLFSHILVIWCSELQVVVEGLWVGAPYYDVPALMSFLTILITTVSFVVSIETNFYSKYKEYYSLFNDRGTLRDIIRMEKEMNKTLKQELWYTGLKQLFFTAASISLGEFVLSRLPLGFNDLMFGYFRTLCVAYGMYAVANTMILLLLYFNDYSGAFAGSLIFAVTTTAFQIAGLLLPANFYGLGFLVGDAVFFAYAAIRLDYFTKRLPYYVLSAQPMVSESKEGKFSRLGVFLEKRLDKQKKSK